MRAGLSEVKRFIDRKIFVYKAKLRVPVDVKIWKRPGCRGQHRGGHFGDHALDTKRRGRIEWIVRTYEHDCKRERKNWIKRSKLKYKLF